MDGRMKLLCEMTVRDGLVVWDLNGLTRDDWTKLGTITPGIVCVGWHHYSRCDEALASNH